MFAKIIALALMAAFYACYFAKMLSQKRRGIATDQLGKGKSGFVKGIEVALKLATCALPVAQVVSIALYTGHVPGWVQAAGLALTALGVACFALSVAYMRDNWRAGVQWADKTSLVTDGIYAISRNPAFLGFDLMYVGLLAAFFNVYLCVATALGVMLFHLQIVNVEEDFLLEAFGHEYLEYKRHVNRYVGRR